MTLPELILKLLTTLEPKTIDRLINEALIELMKKDKHTFIIVCLTLLAWRSKDQQTIDKVLNELALELREM